MQNQIETGRGELVGDAEADAVAGAGYQGPGVLGLGWAVGLEVGG